jgi:DNA-binding transcriptional MerR regulator
MAGVTIGKFAAEQGVSVETIRFYQRRGLLPLPERRGSGYREYGEDERWKLAFIRRAQRLGFTLTEIEELLGPGGAGKHSAGEVQQAAQAKLEALAAQVSELLALQCRLRRLIQVCAHGSPDDCVALHIRDSREAMTL